MCPEILKSLLLPLKNKVVFKGVDLDLLLELVCNEYDYVYAPFLKIMYEDIVRCNSNES